LDESALLAVTCPVHVCVRECIVCMCDLCVCVCVCACVLACACVCDKSWLSPHYWLSLVLCMCVCESVLCVCVICVCDCVCVYACLRVRVYVINLG